MILFDYKMRISSTFRLNFIPNILHVYENHKRRKLTRETTVFFPGLNDHDKTTISVL